MKKILIFLLAMVSYQGLCQTPPNLVQVNNNVWYRQTTTGKWYISSTGQNPVFRQMIDSAQFSAAGGVIPGGPITSLPTVGFNPGTNISPSTFIQNVFYQSQPPLATLTGGATVELMATGGVLTNNLTWTATRQSGTATLATISISGFSQTQNPGFTQPAAGGTVTGPASFTYPRNTTTVFTNTVTTSDSKVATATTTFSFLPKRYWGRTTGIPNSAVLIAAAGGGSELSAVRNKSGFTISASGSNQVFFAYPSSEGALSSLTIGGFESLPAFTQNTVSVTNASGYVQDYFVYVSNNTFSATTPSINTL